MQPDLDRQLHRLLTVVRRRLARRHAVEGAAAGAAAAGALAAVLRLSGATGWPLAGALLTIAVLGAGTWWWMRRTHRTLAAAAHAIERAYPDCRNVVITAEELLRGPNQVQPWMRARVIGDAARQAATLDVTHAVEMTPVGIGAALAIVIAIAAALITPQPAAPVVHEDATASEAAPAVPSGPGALIVTLHPPAYVGGASVTLTNPDRVAALQGTRAHLTIAGVRWRIRFGATPLPLRVEGGTVSTDLVLRDSGYIAVEPLDTPDVPSRLVPVLVTPDRAPVVRVEEPGRDLLLPAARPVAVRASASDDHEVRAMSLRYTRVSGSGEQFEFAEGELPIAITREEARSWRAEGEVPLSRLGLEPGDSLVYRVVARDGRPGEAGVAASDTFFIEIAGPGQVALEGFEMPPERERHALSQQMIVVKIKRLRARERGLSKDALREATAAIAAEQRAVRANFIFLMGGHVEDEEAEAEQSHEIQEGRLENSARREVSRAVGHMTHAEQALTAIDSRAALRQARLAVEALQRAFGMRRYLLRALPVRSRIDPSRRLTGSLDDAADSRREVPRPANDPAAAATLDIMRRLLELAPRVGDGGAAELSTELTAAAELALQVDPADPGWQEVSNRILKLRDAIAAHASREARAQQLQETVDAVFARARRHASAVPLELPRAGGLRSAWADEARR